jgi:hypothetical protein
MDKFIIFHIEGGLGKHVAATAVAATINENCPDRKLVIVCAYPEVFLNLPYIYRVYRIGTTPYFYQNYIKDKDTLICKHEPYFTTEHIVQRKNLIENWCNIYGLKYNNIQPQLIFNVRQQQLGWKKWHRPKPILVLQTNGGVLGEQPYIYSWTRDLPFHISQEIVDYFKNDYYIIQICRDQQQAITGVHEVITEPMSNMELFYLLVMSTKRILIDSCLQHASVAIGLKSVVVWIGTDSNIFGYNSNINIHANLPQNNLPDSYLFDYSFNGITHECPILDWNSTLNSSDIINATING